MIYLFVGEDKFSKDIKLEKIKREFFSRELESFNFDLLYAKDLSLLSLQEALQRLPCKAKKRIILVKEAALLKEPLKTYLLAYSKKPAGSNILILDTETTERKNPFLNTLLPHVRKFQFPGKEKPDVFKLYWLVNQKRLSSALRLLRQLLLEGQPPEQILGGLRYKCENERLNYQEKKRRLGLLLSCDLEMKTGRLRPDLALERLLVNFSHFQKHST